MIIILSILALILSSIGLKFIVIVLIALSVIIFFKNMTQVVIYSIGVFLLDQEINEPELFISMCTALLVPYCHYDILKKNQVEVQKLDNIISQIEENNHQIIKAVSPRIVSFVYQAKMADINSIQDNGFEFLPKDYIQYILDEQAKKGTLEVINLQNTTLYKSKLP